MAPLKVLLAAAALVVAMPAAADPVDRWSAYVAEASARFGLPAEWIRRVIRAESGGRTILLGRPIVSPAGAMGLMQLMPATWREVRDRLDLGGDPHDPRDNILAGSFYLRSMYDRFGYRGMFAAYNAGPARYAQHLASGQPLPRETVAYVEALAENDPPPSPVRPQLLPALLVKLSTVRQGAATAAADDRGSAERSLFVDLGRGGGSSAPD